MRVLRARILGPSLTSLYWLLRSLRHKFFLTLRAAQVLSVDVHPFCGHDGVMAVRALRVQGCTDGFKRHGTFASHQAAARFLVRSFFAAPFSIRKVLSHVRQVRSPENVRVFEWKMWTVRQCGHANRCSWNWSLISRRLAIGGCEDSRKSPAEVSGPTRGFLRSTSWNGSSFDALLWPELSHRERVENRFIPFCISCTDHCTTKAPGSLAYLQPGASNL